MLPGGFASVETGFVGLSSEAGTASAGPGLAGAGSSGVESIGAESVGAGSAEPASVGLLSVGAGSEVASSAGGASSAAGGAAFPFDFFAGFSDLFLLELPFVVLELLFAMLEFPFVDFLPFDDLFDLLLSAVGGSGATGGTASSTGGVASSAFASSSGASTGGTSLAGGSDGRSAVAKPVAGVSAAGSSSGVDSDEAGGASGGAASAGGASPCAMLDFDSDIRYGSQGLSYAGCLVVPCLITLGSWFGSRFCWRRFSFLWTIPRNGFIFRLGISFLRARRLARFKRRVCSAVICILRAIVDNRYITGCTFSIWRTALLYIESAFVIDFRCDVISFD